MIFTVALVIPANTPIASPAAQVLKTTACTVKSVTVDFPLGTYWLVGTRVIYHTHQLYPTNPDAWLVAHGRSITFGDATAIVEAPQELMLEGYNLDDRYDHAVYWCLDVDLLSPAGSAPFVPDIYSGYA